MKKITPTIALSALLLVACNQEEHQEAVQTEATTQKAAAAKSTESVKEAIRLDEHSYGNMHQVELTHLDLDLDVDFDAKSMAGTADLTFVRLDSKVEALILDTRDLKVTKAEIEADGQWQATQFDLAAKDPVLGSKLTIKLGADTTKVRVHYATSPKASGLQWLTPEQTAGKKHPFMYSQAQAIHARSFLPIQDTPAVRVTYKANIRTPKNLLAVMSAFNEPDTELDGDYYFEMPQAISPYLIAIGVGDLKFKAMSDRTGVYSESQYLDSAVAEFNDTERMVVSTEKLFGPYRWGRYDLLILPPSFPFGGMENPRLSFITPTVIAGDKSLVNLIAHELAHSWSGNLVTNATWRDLWINEGFTSYVENRIMEDVFGKKRANMERSLDVQGLKELVHALPKGDTVLHIELNGRDPDDAFSSVPYTKGQMFLVYLEEQFGREKFDVFLNNYFNDYAFKTLTTPDFKVYLKENLLDKHPGVVSDAAIEEWLHQPMLPEMMPNPTSDAFTTIDASTKAWIAGETGLEGLNNAEWTVHEWLHFINNLPKTISLDNMAAMDKAFELTASTNNEIAHAWMLLALQRDYQVIMPRLETYLESIGRRKLIVPLYKALMESEQGATLAKRVYAKARPGYHPLAQNTLDAVMNPTEEKSAAE